jgi:hypothetical protein
MMMLKEKVSRNCYQVAQVARQTAEIYVCPRIFRRGRMYF